MTEPTRRYEVGYFVGSLSSTSINRVLSRGADPAGAARTWSFTEIPIGNLPALQPGLRRGLPAARPRRSRTRSPRSDAVLFVTPEYNRSIPGALKNAIDWASRPWGQNSFDHIPAAVIGASIGPIGTAVGAAEPAGGAQLLQRTADDLARGVHPVLPEVFRDDGEVTDDSTEEFLRDYMAEFRDHMSRVLTVLPRP